MDTILDIDSADKKLVADTIAAVYSSYNNPMAIKYRKLKNIPEAPPAVILQEMVYGDLDENSGTGILFTRDSMGNNIPTGEYLRCKRGPDLVNNIITDTDDSIFTDRREEFEAISRTCELMFKEPQEIEFTIQSGELYVLQSRKLQFNNLTYINILKDMLESKIIDDLEYTAKLEAFFNDNQNIQYIKGTPNEFITGTGTSGGLVKIDNIDDVYIKQKILNSDIEELSEKKAVITYEGAMTSHPSIICRNLGIPYVIIDSRYKSKLIPPFIIDGYSGTIIFDDLEIININITNFNEYM